jgi:hypothetical protein
MRLAMAFGILGVVLAGLALRLARGAVGAEWLLVTVEAYFAICCVGLALLYGLRKAGLPVEDSFLRPGWSVLIRSILFPYLVLAGIVLYLSRWIDREDMMNPVAVGLYVGRLPFPADRARLTGAGVNAVLNLCWEFPRLSGVGRGCSLHAAHLPVLDGSPPSGRQFREATDLVGQWRAEGRTVLIHCAQGHGRSATIAAAVLCHLGLASSADDALSRIRAARPRARPSREQETALVKFLASERSELADPPGKSRESIGPPRTP